MKIFNGPKVQLLKRALNVYSKQHEALADNIANVNHPEYKRKNADFSHWLKEQQQGKLSASNKRHIAVSQTLDQIPIKGLKKEENTVDMTREMGDLAVNQIKFDFAARALRRGYEELTASIMGRFR